MYIESPEKKRKKKRKHIYDRHHKRREKNSVVYGCVTHFSTTNEIALRKVMLSVRYALKDLFKRDLLSSAVSCSTVLKRSTCLDVVKEARGSEREEQRDTERF